MDDGKKLTRELKELVEVYLNARKGRSRQTLAKETGIAYNTITRILQMETVPSFESAYAILKIVADPARVQSFLETYYPAVFELMRDQVQSMNDTGAEFGGLELDEIFSDTLGFSVFCLAAKRQGGTTFEEVERSYGMLGRAKLVQMLDSGFCEEVNGRIKMKANVILDHRVLSRGIRRTLDIVDGHRRNTPYLLSWFCHGLNDKGVTASLECLRAFKKEISTIFLDPANHGDIVVTWGDIMGYLDEEQHRKRSSQSNSP